MKATVRNPQVSFPWAQGTQVQTWCAATQGDAEPYTQMEESSVPVSAALPRQRCQLQAHFRRRNGDYKKLRRAAASYKNVKDR